MNVLHGDMGPSFKYPGRSVNDIIREGFPVSLQLGLESLALALIFGIPAGLAAALKRNQWQDRVINCFATLGMAVPSFVVAALLIDVFALRLGILPAAMWSSWKSQILPAVALAGGAAVDHCASYPFEYARRIGAGLYQDSACKGIV